MEEDSLTKKKYMPVNSSQTIDDETPRKSKYPRRKRMKVNYADFEMSMEESSKYKKTVVKDDSYKDSDSSDEDQNEKENNEISDLQDSVEDVEEEISEYEKLRLKNLEENRRIMMELGLIDPNKEQRIKSAETKRKAAKTPKPRIFKPKTVTSPRKRSLRLLRKTPDGKDLPFDMFQGTPSDSPTVEEKTRIEEEVLPMSEDGESVDFLDNLKLTLSQDSVPSSVESTDNLISDMRSLEFAVLGRVNSRRVQSMCIHPMESKLLIISGSTGGELGLWNVNEDKIVQFNPHLRPINCVSVSKADQTKLFTTSFDGTVRRADITKSVFNLVYQTDEKTKMCHLTWHTEIDENSLLVGHGTGDAGVVDLRAKQAQQWFHCHNRSIRTLQIHPTQPNYFISGSGIGESKIWDLRKTKKHIDEFVGDLPLPMKGKRGITSSFFSPDGKKIAVTSNDDYIRIYDSSDLANPKELHKVMHDNHTGRWLSVFKAVWHPTSTDILFVGSMLQPRRIQLYSSYGRILRELTDDQLTTVVPVLALHPTLPMVVGGNSSGKAHIFTTPEVKMRHGIDSD